MKKTLSSLIAIGVFSATPIMAQDLTIKITNLTNAVYFTPFLVAAHDDSTHLFMEGAIASTNLQTMAEGGDISGLSTDVQSMGGNVVENPAGGFLNPGANTSFALMSNDGNTRLSLTAMMLPTNDGFVGADSIDIPTTAGTYTYYLNAYDAGTEANNEIINGGGAPGTLGIPADPGSNSGTGGSGVASSDNNTMIHTHRGVIGDSDASGGSSDLSNTVHRWLNPVAQLIVTVN
ncbi:spondin domain-containing protein [Pseudomonadota bacterium]